MTIGGRDYPYVQIGNQLWMAENLDWKFSECSIGQSGTSTSEPRANYYNNDESIYGMNGNKYGLLYNWIAVNYIEQNKANLLPSGWHVPTTTEWNTLASEVGGSSIAGTKLKSSTGWESGNGTDDYGFKGLPAGGYDGNFFRIGEFGYFWTITEYNDERAFREYFGSNSTEMMSLGFFKYAEHSLRLVKDLT